MMGRAYDYVVNDGPQPLEAELLYYLDRWGAQAVFGRPLSVGELRRLGLYEQIVSVCRSHQASNNWATWVKENPDKQAIFEKAMMESYEQQD